ncbi:hypothetical protein OF829_15005 [Sphingomonas sp. LB-2]|uniref:hypothetical protein n=1 Tax=Sphingomonas caeni TaxID=2984949 RepID=UPI0022314A9B|nr:hypothetical protein [Sphingomonas caeni]MCW3848542.1 hypothetical protein [Sphingomonas caeni]
MEEGPLTPRKPWSKWTADTERAFLVALRLTGQVSKAAAAIGRSRSSAQSRRRTHPGFAAEWDRAIAEQQAEWIAAAEARLGPGLDAPEDGEAGGRLTPWRDRTGGWDAAKRGTFLRTLARTKSVSRAAEAAGMSASAAYYLRGQSPRFAAAWEERLRAGAGSVLDAAYARAVEGWEEPIVQGGQVVAVKRRYSDGLLRDLLRAEQGAGKARADAAAEADPLVAQARAEVAARKGERDPMGGPWKNAAERHAYEVAKAAGGAFVQKATTEDLTDAILKNLDILGQRHRKRAATLHAAQWARWQRRWGSHYGQGRTARQRKMARP